VFLHPLGSVGQVVHCGASEAQNVDALFFMPGWDRYEYDQWDMLRRNCVSASDGICGLSSAFQWVHGLKCRRTSFHVRVGPLWI
jgi:hypothetical protein